MGGRAETGTIQTMGIPNIILIRMTMSGAIEMENGSQGILILHRMARQPQRNQLFRMTLAKQ